MTFGIEVVSNPLLVYPTQSCNSFATKVLMPVDEAIHFHQNAPVFGIRGGSASPATLDMSREIHNIGAVASYGVVAALLLNCVVDLSTGANFNNGKFSDGIDSSLSRFFSTCTSVCITSGLLAGVMFQCMAIFSRSGIEQGNVEGYKAFQTATVGLSRIASGSFLVCMGSFFSAFMANLHNSTKENGKLGNIIFYFVTILSIAGGIMTLQIQNLASTQILAPSV